MPYIFGKLWHLAIIWAISKAFQCILRVLILQVAKQTRLSPTSENESYLHLSFFIPGHPLRHAARLLVGPHGTRDDCTAPENPNDLVLAFQLQLLMQSISTEAPIIRLMQALLWF